MQLAKPALLRGQWLYVSRWRRALPLTTSTKTLKSNFDYIRGITPKRVTSDGIYLRDLALEQHSSEETSQWWRVVGDTVRVRFYRPRKKNSNKLLIQLSAEITTESQRSRWSSSEQSSTCSKLHLHKNLSGYYSRFYAIF